MDDRTTLVIENCVILVLTRERKTSDRSTCTRGVLLDVDAGVLPKLQLSNMRAGTVAARDERRLFFLDSLECLGDVLHALDVGRIALRPDENEVVVHHREALHALTLGKEFFFRRLGVHEHDVGIAASACVERLPSALRHHLHHDAGLLFEQRQQVFEEAGILRRSGRGHYDRFVLRIDR